MKEIPLRNRAGETVAHALVDDEDYEWLNRWRWSLHRAGYAQRGEMRKRDGKVTWQRVYLMHREILGLKYGDRREGDHINGEYLDNRRDNLRIATKSENGQNRTRKRKGTSSKYRGVSWNSDRSMWLAYANPRSGFKHLGLFDREEEAARASANWRRDNMPFSPEARQAEQQETP